MKAEASITDSMVALVEGEMPMSMQKATRWACGTDIGMQQQKPAMQSSTCTRLGCMPPMRRPAAVTCGRCCGTMGSGVGFSSKVAGRSTTSTSTPKPAISVCQPRLAMMRSNSAGQTTPATYWPDEIRAIAVPRRRSNQRLT